MIDMSYSQQLSTHIIINMHETEGSEGTPAADRQAHQRVGAERGTAHSSRQQAAVVDTAHAEENVKYQIPKSRKSCKGYYSLFPTY